MEIITLTSNSYVHAIKGFSYLFNKFWDNARNVTIVRYDVRPPKAPSNFDNYAIGKQQDFTWSSGLKDFLRTNRIEHKKDRILLLLEDYFLDRKVDLQKIDDIEKFMIDNPHVVKFDLTNDRLKVGHKPFNDEYLESLPTSPFLTSVQAAIWKRDFLIDMLDDKENAWEFEKNGTKRAKTYLTKHNAKILGCYNPPLSYINAIGGMGTKPGEWDYKKFPAWMVDELTKKGLL